MRSTSRFLAVFIAAALLALAGCDSGPKPGEEAVYWGEKLNNETEMAKREAALQHLSDLKDKKALPALYDALKQNTGPMVELRPKVAELIGVIGDDTSVQPLVDAIDWNAGNGRDKETRANANTNEKVAKALARLAKGTDEKAVEALKRLAATNNDNVQLAAIFALGELRAQGAVDDLIQIADGHPNNYMVKNAVEALGKIADPKAAEVLGRLLFFERTGVSFYREASYALFLVGKAAVPVLDQIYDGKFKKIDDLHVEPNLQKTKAVVVYADLAIPETYKKILSGVDMQGNDTATALLRVESQRAVGRLGLKEAVGGLKNRMDNIDIAQSEHALAGLALLGQKDVASTIYSWTVKDGFMKQCKAQGGNDDQCKFSEQQIRKPRILAYSRLSSDAGAMDKLVSDEAANPDFQKWIGEQGERVKAGAECKDLACWKGKLADKSPRVRERAAYELMLANSDEARDALLGALTDDDNEVRYAAIVGVGRRLPKDVAVADKLTEQLNKEKGSTQYVRVNEDLKRLEVRIRRGY